MSHYARPHDTHSPSPTRDHILAIETENQGPVRRILFTDASEAPDRSPFRQRLLVWERDRERHYFVRRYASFDPSSPDSFLHLLPNSDWKSWNLDFDLEAALRPREEKTSALWIALADHRLDELKLEGPNFLDRYPDALSRDTYPGPRFVPIVSEGWWSHPFPGRALHPNVPVWNPSPPDILSTRPYAFYIEDCYDPPVYVVFADSEEDAYERAKDWFSVYYPGTRIEESEYADYLSVSPSQNISGVLSFVGQSPRDRYRELVSKGMEIGSPSRDEALAYFFENYVGDHDQWGNPIDVESFRMVPLRILSIDFC